MAAQAGGLFHDQNLNVHYNGVPTGGKTNVSKAQKKGGLGGRRALNDISNSGKPSSLQASKKHNSRNVISVGEDIGACKSIFAIGGKINVSKTPEKVQAGGRKALSDLTNSGKPHVHQAAPKKSLNKKLSAVAEEQTLPNAIAEEQFLHNHQECIKAQRKAMDMDYFLKTIGLDKDITMQLASPWVSPLSRKMKPESPSRCLEMEEMSELLIEDHYPRCRKTELPGEQDTPCGSPKSPKPSMPWKDYNFSNFMLMETPELPKH
ncbi:hypothetical protein F0562_026641 [Nyssa sinensis]|uniref:Uncharacterized protein n=1 Tax=Nyssa sinensis TaxID=561372 RepID=A0A5J5BBA0_9ASTE|nr:hypothetical protein F0562_026641 [Nyssa sinensis]